MIIDGLNRFIAQQSRAIYLAIVLAVLAGLVGLASLPSGIYPEVIFPRVVVLVEAGDTAPQILLPNVTRPIEEAVTKIPGFRQVRTQTLRGNVETSVEFDNHTDIELALQQVRGRVGELRATFPANSNVTIERLMPSVFPVLSYNLRADNISVPELADLALYQIRPRLLQVPGVAQVKVQNAQNREYSIEVKPDRIAALHLSLSQIATAIQMTNQVSVVGRSQQDHQQALMMGTGEMFNADALKSVVIATRGGVPVTLGQIAQVHEGATDRLSAFSGSGKPAVLISILKQPNGNLLEIADSVNRELPAIKAALPIGVTIEPVYDLAQLVSASIENLRDAIMLGIVLIVVVIYFFLKDWRSTVIAAITIPITVAITFGLMALGHQTLNLMSLGGLAVAVGLVIDDAIVMIEGIFHNRQLGFEKSEATQKAINDLSWPVISSTITTIVVFSPLGLLEGVVGQFFTAFCFTLAASVLVSLFLALSLTPTLCTKLLKPKAIDHSTSGERLSQMRIIFQKFDQYALRNARAVVGIAVILILLLFPMSALLERGFMPEIDEGSFVLDYYAPPGTSLADTDHVAAKIEGVLAQMPDVRSWSRRTGARLALAASETSMGDILVRLHSFPKRTRSTDNVMADVRNRLATAVPGIDIELTQILQDLINDLSDSPAPVAVKIYGNEEQTLKQISTEVGDTLKDIHGLVDINTRIRPSATEQTIRVDPVATGRFGMTVGDVLTQVQTAFLGTNATSIREQEKMIPVRVRYDDETREKYTQQPDALPVFNVSGTVLPLKALAAIKLMPGIMEIRRENLARLGLVTAHLEGRDLGSAMDEVKSKLAKLQVPSGYYIAYGGQYASQQTAFLNLTLVLALAVLLVYLVLVIQFRSLLTPLPILLAIPLSLFGVFLGLILTHTALNISSFMGVILLVGLVVKNGIILLARAEQHEQMGASIEDSHLKAVQERIRPIMMTTVCTLLGLLPLAFGIGSGADLQKPLAIAVISGLTVSTLITLVATPSLHKLIVQYSRTHLRIPDATVKERS